MNSVASRLQVISERAQYQDSVFAQFYRELGRNINERLLESEAIIVKQFSSDETLVTFLNSVKEKLQADGQEGWTAFLKANNFKKVKLVLQKYEYAINNLFNGDNNLVGIMAYAYNYKHNNPIKDKFVNNNLKYADKGSLLVDIKDAQVRIAPSIHIDLAYNQDESCKEASYNLWQINYGVFMPSMKLKSNEPSPNYFNQQELDLMADADVLQVLYDQPNQGIPTLVCAQAETKEKSELSMTDYNSETNTLTIHYNHWEEYHWSWGHFKGWTSKHGINSNDSIINVLRAAK